MHCKVIVLVCQGDTCIPVVFSAIVLYCGNNYIQWNFCKRAPRIAETSVMQTNGRGPESFPIVYCT